MNASAPLRHSISATSAKQNFGEAIERAAEGPLEIKRHGRTVAIMVPPGYEFHDLALERKLARANQEKVEAERLIRHQRIAIKLLKDPVVATPLVDEAKAVVDRWEREALCSSDFVSMWRRLLALPVPVLAERICDDLNGWGAALRQNSPWLGK